MKSFKNFITEAEEVPDKVKPESIVQPSLPGTGKSAKNPKKTTSPEYNPRDKYYTPDGKLRPNAVQTFIQRRMGGPYNRSGVKLTPEIKARLDSANQTFSSAATGDPKASQQVAQWTKEFQAKYPSEPPISTPPTSTKNTPQGRAADAQFRTKLELDTPQGADAAQQAARDMAADARTGSRKPKVGSGSSPQALKDLSKAVDTVPPEPQLPRIRGVVARTQTGTPITTSTTRSSTAPAPAPAPQRAVTAAIDRQRQSAAASTPAAVKKQNAAVMGTAARTLSKVAGGYAGYDVGQRRGEGTAGKLTRAIGAGLATDALASAVYNRLPRPLKTVGAVVTAAASQKGVNSLITTLRQQLGMK